MKRVALYTPIAYMLLCISFISCQHMASSDESDTELAKILSTEQYFEGNLCYSTTSAFLEESISGTIIPIDMAGLPFMIETEYPQIKDKEGIPTHIKLSGYLTSKENKYGIPEMHLTIKKITAISDGKEEIQPMTGIYNGDGHTLTVSSNHVYALLDKNGKLEEGNWFLHSSNTMILSSGDSKRIMKINYKKKSLNERDDHPTVFMFSTNLSNH